MKNKILIGLAALTMVAFLSSCGKVPQAKIDAVTAAIDSAITGLQADVYVPAALAAVQDSMKAINTEIEAKKSKLFKNFKEVEAKLDVALVAAQKVQTDAVAKKEEVKKSVETLMTEIKAVVEENGKLMKRAPRGKEGAAVLEQMKNEMTTVETSVTDAQGMYDKGAYMDAFNKVTAAKETADKINGELKEAMKKAGIKI
jgi:regulator of replication initiation timing